MESQLRMLRIPKREETLISMPETFGAMQVVTSRIRERSGIGQELIDTGVTEAEKAIKVDTVVDMDGEASKVDGKINIEINQLIELQMKMELQKTQMRIMRSFQKLIL